MEIREAGLVGCNIPLDELLDRVNRVASKLFPAGKVADSRVSPVLVARTFRHYTTLGRIDPGRRVGRRVVYGLRHFLQALLVRRLLADGVTGRRMPELVSGSDNQELRRMVLDGVQLQPGGAEGAAPLRETTATAEQWIRTRVAPGVELQLRDDLPRFTAVAIRQLMAGLEKALRQHGR